MSSSTQESANTENPATEPAATPDSAELSDTVTEQKPVDEQTTVEKEASDTTNTEEVVTEQTSEEGEGTQTVEEPPSLEEVIAERDKLKTQVEELQGRLYKMSEAYQKKSTEVEGTRKRLEKLNEFNQAKLRGQVVSNIFTPFENLKRSIDSCAKAGVDDGLTSGLTMVRDEFWSAFQKLGLEEVPGVGTLFNPNIHEALTTMPVDDPVKNDTVVQVYSTGYRINDTVVRTAQVIVGKYYAPPKAEKPTEATAEATSTEEQTESQTTSTSSDDVKE
jgi:molecular chaperone GrpE